MKTSLLFFVSIFLFSGLFSQSIISYSQVYTEPGHYTYGNVMGYNTHFKQADSCKITFTSASDTIRFWVNNAVSDTYMHIQSPSLLPIATWYKLSVENSIDSVMNLSYAFTVLDTSFMISYGYPKPIGRSEVNSNSKVAIQLFNTKSIANVYDSAFYIQPGVDTIAVDSIIDLADYQVTVYAFLPTAAKPGSYDLFIYKNQDTMTITRGALFLSNSFETQIESVSPDSIDNQHWKPWTIYVYGNKTHFTNDSNIIIIDAFHTNGIWGGVVDSIQVMNDTLLKFNIMLPMPVKQAVNPNSMLYIYNPTDGLMAYPMVVLLYGSIGDQLNNYESVKLYPNPVQNKFWIESDEFAQDHLKICIYSVAGVLCGEYEFSNTKRIQLSSNMLSKGVYFVYIQGAKKAKVIRFIKQ
jgi:hypothetical protein